MAEESDAGGPSASGEDDPDPVDADGSEDPEETAADSSAGSPADPSAGSPADPSAGSSDDSADAGGDSPDAESPNDTESAAPDEPEVDAADDPGADAPEGTEAASPGEPEARSADDATDGSEAEGGEVESQVTSGVEPAALDGSVPDPSPAPPAPSADGADESAEASAVGTVPEPAPEPPGDGAEPEPVPDEEDGTPDEDESSIGEAGASIGEAGASTGEAGGVGEDPVDVEAYREDYGLAEEVPEGPPDDQEMPLTEHIEEMILRLAIVSAVAAVVASVVFFLEPVAEDTIMHIWNAVLPIEQYEGAAARPRVYGPLELKLTELKFASLAGFVLALPVFVYQTYRFMRPGLYPHERRYYLAAVPTSLVLAFVGVTFSYYVVLPGLFLYFFRYSDRAGTLAFALRQTFDLILVLMGYMALVFQIPLFIMLAIMMGLADRQWMEDKRLLFWGAFLGVSFLFIPEPTGMAPIVVAVTMVALFEGTLALLRWTGH